MKTVKFITVENNKRITWGTFANREKAIDFMRYIINNLKNSDKFFVVEIESNKAVKMLDLARYYGII